MSQYIAIDLEANGVYAAFGDTRGGAKVTHAVAWTADDAEPPPVLTLDTARTFGEGLRAKLRAGGPPAPVLVSVGRDRVILKELRHPPVPPAEEPALIRFQAVKEMSDSPDDVVLDYVPLGAADATGEQRAMAVVLRKDVFHAIQAMCVAAGLKLAGVTPRPYAVTAGLMRAFAAGTAPGPDARGDTVAALTLAPGGGELTICRGGEVILTLALPGPVVASDTMLVAQLRRNLTVYAGQHPGHPVRAVYLAEVGGAWAAKMGAALGVPVHAYDPLAGALPKVPDAVRGRFAGAVGLLAGKAADALPINFAAPRQPTTARDPAKKRLLFAALAVAALLLAGVALAVFVRDVADGRVDDLAQRRDELKAKTDKNKADVKKADAVGAWEKREVVWLDELFDMVDRMPAADTVRIAELKAIPVPPTKDGKGAQAKVDLKMAATASTPVGALRSAVEGDNTATNKFYTNSPVTVLGTVAGATAATRHREAFGLVVQVNRRAPNLYERNPKFVPPKRSWGAFGLIPVAATEPPPEPPPESPPEPVAAPTVEPAGPVEVAPAPKEKA